MSGGRYLNAYIDESGDEGFTRLGLRARGLQGGSSEWLVLGAVVIPQEQDALATRLVDRLRIDLEKTKTKTKKPLHWRDLRNDHNKKRRAMDLLANADLTFSAVAFSKRHLEGRGSTLERRKGYLYNYAGRFLIERLSWIAREQSRQVHLLFESRATTSYGDLQHYVTTIQGRRDCKISPGTIASVRPIEATRKGAQLADFFVSAAAEALEPNFWGYTEEDYLMRVRERLYRPPGRDVLSYGFKIFPPQAVDHSRYGWLSSL